MGETSLIVVFPNLAENEIGYVAERNPSPRGKIVLGPVWQRCTTIQLEGTVRPLLGSKDRVVIVPTDRQLNLFGAAI
jgi:hypothetical protein